VSLKKKANLKFQVRFFAYIFGEDVGESPRANISPLLTRGLCKHI